MNENIKLPKMSKAIKKVNPRTPPVERSKSIQPKKEPQSFPLQKDEMREVIDEDIEFLMNQASSMSKNSKKEKKNNKCPHSSIINEGGTDICVDCGENIQIESFDTEWRYYGDGDKTKSYDPSRCQYRKIQDKGIKKELEKMGFSRDVIDKADYYYQKVTQGDIKRSALRKGIIFSCVLFAYKHYKMRITTDELDEIFKIGRKNMSKGLTYFKTNIPKNEIDYDNFDYATAEHFIPKILEKWNVKEEHVNFVLNLYNKLSNKSHLINTSNPQSVSSGLVYYYLKKLELDITPSKFGKIVGLSEITINRITNEIEDILINDEV